MTTEQISVEHLLELEGELQGLVEECQQWRSAAREGFCANVVWYGYPGYGIVGIKRRMCDLIGHARIRKTSRESHIVYSARAYDLIYEYLYRLLPDCKHDGHECGFRKKRADVFGWIE